MAENKEEESSKRVIYTYPMVKQTDMPDDMKVKLLELYVENNLETCEYTANDYGHCTAKLWYFSH